MNIFDIYLQKIKKIIVNLNKKQLINIPEDLDSINVDIPPEKFHADISSNVAMIIGKYNKINPMSFGKTIEHYVPFMENFPINPNDVRFFGNPIDYIAFTDMGSKKKCAVHFLEVKSGESTLNGRQRNIKDAIQKGRVYWHEYNANGIWTHETKDQHLNEENDG